MVELFIKLGLPATQAQIFAEQFTVTEKLSPGQIFSQRGSNLPEDRLGVKGQMPILL